MEDQTFPPLLRLDCCVNSYDWGKIGHDSAAARFGAATGLAVDPNKPYAELWMGTHPSGPSRVLVPASLSSSSHSQPLLADILSRSAASLLSPTVAQKFDNSLPFLLKVLSIRKALSIQAHPNKTLAAALHARDPAHYPDANHKPEMAIALTEFSGFCGFRPLAEIAHFLDSVPALRALVGDDVARAFIDGVKALLPDDDGGKPTPQGKELLKTAFSALMRAPVADVQRHADDLVKSATLLGTAFAAGGVSSTPGSTVASLVQDLAASFPGDIGLFALFFLNHVTLSPGEALFLVADDVHAYLSGDIVECMAASDNVVRAGFTPKFKDVDTLIDMLTYNYAPIAEQKMTPAEYPYAALSRAAYSAGSTTTLYDPPGIDEFAVVRTVVRGGREARVTFDPLDGPSMLICTQGYGRFGAPGRQPDVEVKEGHVYFVGSGVEVVISGEGDKDADDFVVFRAFCEVA